MQARVIGKAVESFIVMVWGQSEWRGDRARSREKRDNREDGQLAADR